MKRINFLSLLVAIAVITVFTFALTAYSEETENSSDDQGEINEGDDDQGDDDQQCDPQEEGCTIPDNSDGKTVPGTICKPKYNSDEYMIGLPHKVYNRDSTNHAWFFCPLPRDIMDSGSRAWNRIKMHVDDMHYYDDIVCWACSMSQDGSTGSCESKDTDDTGINLPLEWTSARTRYSKGYFIVYCDVPDVWDDDDYSGIVTIKCEEP